jgi:hypothetical protein
MFILLLICICIILICIYLIILNSKKLSNLEEALAKLDEDNEKLINFISSLNVRLHTDFSHLKEIDRRGSFESDDEVGFVFNTIKGIIEDSYKIVNEFLNTIEDNAEEELE